MRKWRNDQVIGVVAGLIGAASHPSFVSAFLPFPPKSQLCSCADSSPCASHIAGSASPGRYLSDSQRVFEIEMATPKRCGVCENKLNPHLPWFCGYGMVFCSEACRGAYAEDIEDEEECDSALEAEKGMRPQEEINQGTANPRSERKELPWFQQPRERAVSPNNVLDFGDSPTNVLELRQSYYAEARLHAEPQRSKAARSRGLRVSFRHYR